ncbi:hypothetical protein [Crateriforma conspicua]|uniref:Uncharacterized protein n=1 Tax=Crateriforma conspicua TaxID=2527996 RepID=A0A5C5XQL6_9PLAN|nr:hypothetical protein [Crateriforma conspicua]TWT64928.1 hypothetical protein Pan14r_54710 [Crateriforma conspicua]
MRVTIACNGAGLARFHKWNINLPGPLMRTVTRIKITYKPNPDALELFILR